MVEVERVDVRRQFNQVSVCSGIFRRRASGEKYWRLPVSARVAGRSFVIATRKHCKPSYFPCQLRRPMMCCTQVFAEKWELYTKSDMSTSADTPVQEQVSEPPEKVAVAKPMPRAAPSSKSEISGWRAEGPKSIRNLQVVNMVKPSKRAAVGVSGVELRRGEREREAPRRSGWKFRDETHRSSVCWQDGCRLARWRVLHMIS